MTKPFVDITGKRYGKLVALSYAGVKDSGRGREKQWLCQCDCGNTCTTRYRGLINGHAKSCGCIGKSNLIKHKLPGGWNKIAEGEACFNNLFHRAQNNAKGRKHCFELTKLEYRTLTKMNCYYCGQPPSQISRAKGTYGTYVFNGIDRINSNIGYITGNVRACCKTCNFAKGTLTEEEFYQWIDRLIAYRIHGNRSTQVEFLPAS